MNSLDYRLMNFLLTNGPSTIEELADSENVSTRTMQKYLQGLDEALGQIAKVENNQQGFFLTILHYRRFAQLQSGILKQNIDMNDQQKRVASLLMLLVKNRDYSTAEQLAEQLMISRGTLLKDMDVLKRWTKDYQVDIITVPRHGVRLEVGTVSDLIMLISNFAYDYLTLRQDLGQQLTETVDRTLRTSEIKASSIALFKRLVVILGYLKRLGYRLTALDANYCNFLGPQPVLTQLFATIEEGMATRFSTVEREFLVFPLNLYPNPLLSTTKLDQAMAANERLFMEIAQEIQTQVITGIDYSQFYQQIRHHLLFLINRAIFHLTPSDYITDKILTKFQFAADLANLVIRQLETRLNICIAPIETNYLTVYFEMALNRNVVDSDVRPHVGFLGGMGQGIQAYLQNQLDVMFDSQVKIVAYANENEVVKHQANLIMVFTDRPLTQKLNIPVAMISDIFRDQILDIKVKASAIQHEMRHGHVVWQVSQSRVNAKTTYEAVIRQAAAEDVATGFADADFPERLALHESDTKLVLTNGVAIPHALTHQEKGKLLLHFVRLDAPLIIRHQNIMYIFIIGIPKVMDQRMLRDLSMMYDLLFQIAVNETTSANLAKITRRQQTLTEVMEGL